MWVSEPRRSEYKGSGVRRTCRDARACVCLQAAKPAVGQATKGGEAESVRKKPLAKRGPFVQAAAEPAMVVRKSVR